MYILHITILALLHCKTLGLLESQLDQGMWDINYIVKLKIYN